MTHIKDEIERGTYTVDPKAVAEAILRRLDALVATRPATALGQPKNACS